jgi:arylsulfatase A-like enzyme
MKSNLPFIVLAGLCAVVSGEPQSRAAQDSSPKRPNILWIVADDLGVELGCYGVSIMRTPAIDNLARQGARFTRCFTTAPVCSPSRSALMTGMYQTTINAHDHRSLTKLPSDVKPITDYFRQAGYFTANVKKIGPDLKSHGKTDYNFTVQKPFDGEDFDDLTNHQPFFAELQFVEPHRGSWKPGQTMEYRVDPAKVDLPPYYPDDPVVRKDWAGYLDVIDYLDTKVAAILKRLEEKGLDQNTIVFFFGDNGRCHVRDKQWLYEGGLHIPLIVRWPGQLKPGTVRDDMVSAIDISATSLKLAGAVLPKNMQGQVFLGPGAQSRKYIFGARDRCDETVDRIRSVRDDRYKYIRNFMPERPYTQPNAYKERAYPALAVMKRLHSEGNLTPEQELFMAPQRPPEELYDLKNDPHEVHNLAQSAAQEQILKDLRAAMQKWMTECDDRPERHGAMRQ